MCFIVLKLSLLFIMRLLMLPLLSFAPFPSRCFLSTKLQESAESDALLFSSTIFSGFQSPIDGVRCILNDA